MLVRTALGPISMIVSTPDRARLSIPCWNRTGCSTWAPQYSGVATAAVASVPVTLEISLHALLGACRSTAPNTLCSSRATQPIRGEWNAWETSSRLCFSPTAWMTFIVGPSGPAMTVSFGPLAAAMDTWVAVGSAAMASFMTPSGAKTATMIPPVGCSCMSRERSASISKASSNAITPDKQAATISPRLCPMTTSGCMPCPCRTLASAYSTANNAGWAYRVWLMSLVFSGPNSEGSMTCSRGLGSMGSRI
mmetsp:Transcript_103490/g.178316  ORF Transcript_103490/g.178316 Transcript_103490/m.178316 type:complete len:250 (+) Transcript_103490:4094-4843(+)